MSLFKNKITGKIIKMNPSAQNYLLDASNWVPFSPESIVIPDVIKEIKEQPKKRGRNAKL